MTTQRVWRRFLRWLPKPIRSGGWKAFQWLKNEQPGLLMVYQGAAAPPIPTMHDGVVLRTWRHGDDPGWIALLNENGAFGLWDASRLASETAGLLEDGQFFAVANGKLVAGAGVLERPLKKQPALEIGWVVRHPEYKAERLGLVVTLAALGHARAVAASRPIYLYTDDHRLTAIAMYLEIGFTPDLRSHRSYPRRWERVFLELGDRRQSGSSDVPANS